ncbi:hypothetical protein Moror_14379, partial [Moniliophthora roreri MCA 2997]
FYERHFERIVSLFVHFTLNSGSGVTILHITKVAEPMIFAHHSSPSSALNNQYRHSPRRFPHAQAHSVDELLLGSLQVFSTINASFPVLAELYATLNFELAQNEASAGFYKVTILQEICR